MNTNLLAAKIRRHIVDMTHKGNSSHVASGLSIADILSVLYGKIMEFDPKKPQDQNRDKFILSKGHAGAAVYAVLAEVGFFPVKKLEDHYQNGSIFSGHVSHKGVPGVELSTGSLGHGLSVGAGMAMASKLRKKDNKVYVLLSDGECDEGSNWEAILFASHHKLNNLVALIDYNKIQSLTSIANTLELEPFAEKFISFGWNVLSIDGHNHDELTQSLKSVNNINSKPTAIICNTTKGKGVSFMEDKVLWHYRSPQDKEYQDAIHELDKAISKIKQESENA